MNDFWLCFVTLFVAVDPVGLLPSFMALTEGLERHHLRQVILQSMLTASVVAVAFLVFGPALLSKLGITVPDFMIAGGLLLLVFTLADLLAGEKRLRQPDLDSLGAVPIGVPLITGPAVLTSCIVLANVHGKPLTAIAVIINIILAGIVFSLSEPITKWIGRTGAKAVSKIASLLLAAIAVMFIRKGLTEAILSLSK
jgi:multiple antibiotic resistance protein